MSDSTCRFPAHAATTGYQYGCRCERCRTWWNGYKTARLHGLPDPYRDVIPAKPCERCGWTFTPKQNRTKFCSAACRNPVAAIPNSCRLGECSACTGPLRKALTGGGALCPNCVPSYDPRCHHCAALFTSKQRSPSRRFCSKACRTAAKPPQRQRIRPPKQPKAPEFFPCAECGISVLRKSGTHKRCSECSRLRNIERIMGLYRTAFESRDVRVAMHWRYELVDYLRSRDGDRCGLCSERMMFDVPTGPRGHDDGATVDHILPRSLGGLDDIANLHLAHWRCNRAKGNRSTGEQLRLIG